MDLSARTENTMLKKALGYIKDHGEDNGEYEIVLAENETDSTATGYIIGTYETNPYNTGTKTDSHTGRKINLTITLKSLEDTAVTITKNAAGPLFTVYGFNAHGFKVPDIPHLILENITLQGYGTNTSPLVAVGDIANNSGYNKKGTLTMKAGSRITGNTNTSYGGGGVRVGYDSVFTMLGGSIDSNRANGGAGVYNYSAFTMKGGDIANNRATGNGGGVTGAGTFTMEGGTIRGNSAANAGAVYIGSYGQHSFSKTGGIIYGTEAGANANTGAHAIAGVLGRWRDLTANEYVILSSDSDANWGI
jgi:hypothetical protein